MANISELYKQLVNQYNTLQAVQKERDKAKKNMDSYSGEFSHKKNIKIEYEKNIEWAERLLKEHAWDNADTKAMSGRWNQYIRHIAEAARLAAIHQKHICYNTGGYSAENATDAKEPQVAYCEKVDFAQKVSLTSDMQKAVDIVVKECAEVLSIIEKTKSLSRSLGNVGAKKILINPAEITRHFQDFIRRKKKEIDDLHIDYSIPRAGVDTQARYEEAKKKFDLLKQQLSDAAKSTCLTWDIDPISSGLYSDTPLSKDAIARGLKQILANAKTRTYLDIIPGTFTCYAQDHTCLLPETYFPDTWQDKDNDSIKNIQLRVNKSEVSDEELSFVIKWYSALFMMAFAPGNIHITFVDPKHTSLAVDFYRRLGDEQKRYVEIASDRRAIEDLIGRLQTRNRMVEINTQNLERDNELDAQGRLTTPYEVVFLLGYDPEDRSFPADLTDMMAYGNKLGVYFMLTTPGDCKLEGKYADNVHRICSLTSNAALDPIIEAYCSAAKVETAKREAMQATIRVEIGRQKASGKTATFDLFDDTKPHSMVIGTTGSGKSVLVNSVLTRAMQQTSPEQLEVYIMDFKDGGTDFVEMRDYPHVSHLIISRRDKSIVLEVMRDLQRRMQERGEQLRKAGVKNLADYNLKNPSKPMPRILLVVDECQWLFRTNETYERKIQSEINSVVTSIAEQGRSQCVSLLLVTQAVTEMGEESNKVYNNITNRFMFRCNSREAMLFLKENGEKVLNQLEQYEVYNNASDSIIRSDAPNAALHEKARKQILAMKPVRKHAFVFDGKIHHQMPSTIETSNVPMFSIGEHLSTKPEASLTLKMSSYPGQNLLIVGINERHQADRVFAAALLSARKTAAKVQLVAGSDDERDEQELMHVVGLPATDIKDALREAYALFVERQQSEAKTPSLVIGLSRQDLNANKLRQKVNVPTSTTANAAAPTAAPRRALLGVTPTADTAGAAPMMSLSQILETLLRDAGAYGIHFIVQIENSRCLLGDQQLTQSMMEQMFEHYAVLYTTSSDIALPNAIREANPATLSRDNDLLRALYLKRYKDPELFTPYEFNF